MTDNITVNIDATEPEIAVSLDELRYLVFRGLVGDSAYDIAVKLGFVGTEAEWLASLKGGKGDPGADGYSPTVQVTNIPGGNRVTITDKNGPKEFEVDDGISPSVLVADIEGGHRVTITGAEGSRTFNVMDGATGEDGDDGHSPYINSSGYWVFWNDSTGAWVTTNYKAAGTPGADGHSPYIGQNGNWFAWDDNLATYDDTGVEAQGADGARGPSAIVQAYLDDGVVRIAEAYESYTADDIYTSLMMQTDIDNGVMPLVSYSPVDGDSVYFELDAHHSSAASPIIYFRSKDYLLSVDSTGVYTLTNRPQGGGSSDAVLYTEQTLTPAQKEQARENIGAGTYSKPIGGIPASDMASGAIPSKTSELTNDSGFLTPSQVVAKGRTVIDPTLLTAGAAADALSVREAFVANVQPLFVDVLAGNWLGSQNAAFSNSAENAEKYFTFSGTEGSDAVSVAGGTASIASLTNGQWWRGIVEYDDGTCVPTMVSYQGTADTLHIFPALTAAVTSGKIMPSLYSIHATSLGYKWYAQYVYGSNAKHCLKSKPIARWLARNSDAIPFTKINSFWWGENNGNVQRSLQVCNATLKHLHMNIDKSASAATPKGFLWTVNVGGRSGYAEILMSGNYASDFFAYPEGEGFVIELYQDGVLAGTYHKTTVHYERICLDFSACENIELRVYTTGNSVTHTIELTEVSVWETGAFDRAELLPFGSVPAQMFDSWGVQFDSATATEFKRLHTLKLGVTAPWENHSQGGATSAWGRAWFYENVVKYHPTHVLIDFIINDSNGRGASGFAQTVEGPDGAEYDNIMNTVDEYIDNMLAIIKMAMSYGIQPIVCLAPYSDNEKPEWSYRLIDKWSVDPERFEFSILKGAESPQSFAEYAEKTWVQNQGYQTAAQVQTAIAGLQTKAITDTGGYFTTDTVEGALQEIGAELSGVNTLIGSGVIT